MNFNTYVSRDMQWKRKGFQRHKLSCQAGMNFTTQQMGGGGTMGDVPLSRRGYEF